MVANKNTRSCDVAQGKSPAHHGGGILIAGMPDRGTVG